MCIGGAGIESFCQLELYPTFWYHNCLFFPTNVMAEQSTDVKALAKTLSDSYSALLQYNAQSTESVKCPTPRLFLLSSWAHFDACVYRSVITWSSLQSTATISHCHGSLQHCWMYWTPWTIVVLNQLYTHYGQCGYDVLLVHPKLSLQPMHNYHKFLQG